MSTGISQSVANCISVEAGEDLSSYQYRYVKFSSGKAVHCDTLGEDHIGILQNAPTAGQAALIAMPGGTAKVAVAEAITAGMIVGPNVTTGKAINTGIAATGKFVGGMALEGGSADGAVIEVFVLHYKHY